jgi:hypothetical protein
MRYILRKPALLLLICLFSFFFIGRTADCKERVDEEMIMDIRENLERTVRFLSEDIGSRGYLQKAALNRAADYIGSELRGYGYEVRTQPYDVDGVEYRNVFAIKKGLKSPDRVLVLGAHYDTVIGTPGADDNASAVAGMLELARLLKDAPLDKTLHFAAFTLEEPPFFRTSSMGSYKYAGGLKKEGMDVEGMICLESIGYFTDREESQLFPLPFFRLFYPTTGNFIMFASNFGSKGFLDRAKEGFTKGTDLPLETISAPSFIPGMDFSDHRSFWKFGYDAFMVTDTAFYRNPNYHTAGDLPETLDFKRMSEVVLGLRSSIENLAKD